jgi:hypothetical protein
MPALFRVQLQLLYVMQRPNELSDLHRLIWDGRGNYNSADWPFSSSYVCLPKAAQ